MKKIFLLVLSLQSFGLLYSMQNGDFGNIKYIELATGALPIKAFPVPFASGGINNHFWNAYSIHNDRVYMPITRAYVEGSDDTLVLVDNLVFDLHNPEKPILHLTEETGNEMHQCGNDFVIMNNGKTLYFTQSNDKTDFNHYIQQVSPNKQRVVCLEYPWYEKCESNSVHFYNELGRELQTTEDVTFFRAIPKTNVIASVSFERSLKALLVAWEDIKTEKANVMITDSGKVFELPELFDTWSIFANQLSEEHNFLYLPSHEKDGVHILVYDIAENSWNFFSKVFDRLWYIVGTLPGNHYVLAKSNEEPFYVWDLHENKKVDIEGIDEINKIAHTLNLDDDRWEFNFNFGTNRIVLSTRYRSISEVINEFGFIVDIAEKKVLPFTKENSFVNYWITRIPDEYTFVRYIVSSNEGKKLYNFAKIHLNDNRPIEWIENIEISERLNSDMHSDYYLITHQDGFQQMQQLPENNYFSATLQEYFQTPYRSSYIPQTNRVVTIQKNHDDLLGFEGEANKIISCQRHRYDQEEFVIVHYQDGQIARLSTEEYESVVQEMKQIRIQQLLLDSVNSESDFDEQSKYTITVRDADSGQEQQTIFCDTYRLAETADRTIVYLVTYKQGDENAKVWYLLDKQMDNTTDDEQARRFIGGLCLLQ